MQWRFLGLLARTELRLIWVFSGSGRVRQIVRLKYERKCEAAGYPTKRLKTRFLPRNRVFNSKLVFSILLTSLLVVAATDADLGIVDFGISDGHIFH